jgi:hypothetical protein
MDGITVPVVKLSEDGTGDLITRVKNELDVPTAASIEHPYWQGGRSMRVHLAAEELTTIRIPKDPEQRIYETDIPELKGESDLHSSVSIVEAHMNGHSNGHKNGHNGDDLAGLEYVL